MKNKIILTTISALAIGIVIGLFIPFSILNSEDGSFGNGSDKFSERVGERGSGQFGGPEGRLGTDSELISGSIISIDDERIVIENDDGESFSIPLNDDITINQSETLEISDLSVGSTISVFGESDANGTVSTQMINVGNGFSERKGPQR